MNVEHLTNVFKQEMIWGHCKRCICAKNEVTRLSISYSLSAQARKPMMCLAASVNSSHSLI